MYQEIAVAKGPEYDTLNQRMDCCQESIESLSDDIQRLQVRVWTWLKCIYKPLQIVFLSHQACLGDEELKAEEDTVEETKRRNEDQSRRAQLEAQVREEQRRLTDERR